MPPVFGLRSSVWYRQTGKQIKPFILTFLSVIPTRVEESLTIFSSLYPCHSERSQGISFGLNANCKMLNAKVKMYG